MDHSWINRWFTLETIRSFLEHVSKDVRAEWNEIEEYAQDGQYKTFEDLESAHDLPIARLRIGMRATLYELNALIESEIYELAKVPWIGSKKHKGPKGFDDIKCFDPDLLVKIKMVSDLGMGDIVNLVETHYGIKLADIEKYDEITNIRDAVNSYKHRKGVKHFREIDWKNEGFHFPQKYELNIKDVFEAIKHTEMFLQNLDNAVTKI